MKKFLQRDIYRERMLINGILILMSAWYIGSCLWVSLQRADYPYELEWCESPIIDQALRIYDHEPYYVPPSLEWVTLIYTPLYFYLGAFSMKILGVSFAALRIISILSTIGIGVLIYKILRSQGGDDTSSISAPGLFFAAYSATGAWYDLARVDMLALLLAVLAALFMIRGDKPKNAVLSALCITLAFFTKQSFLILIILFAVHWFLAGRKSFLYYFIIVGTNLAAGFLFLHFQSQGLFWYYTFTAPAKHDLFSDRWLTFWTKDIILKYPVMSVLTVYILYFTVRKLWMNFFDYRRSALVFIVIGFFLTAWMGRLKVGGYDNTVIPAVIALALLSGIAM
nr:glycosyltransferase family 39 protein [FCB group bacterium]